MEEIFEKTVNLAQEFIDAHKLWEEKETKSGAAKARKAANELKKVITDYKKASMEACKK